MTTDLLVAPSIFYPTFNSKARRIVHQGGQWSGKTVNILFALAVHANNNKNEITTVTAESLPHLRGGALRDFERFIYSHIGGCVEQYNKSEHIFYFKSGSLIEFKSFEDEFSARGPKRHRLFINEINKFNYMKYFQLDGRTEIQTIVDYNPTSRFWVHDNLIGESGTDFFISDHRSNPFLSEAKHAEIENIKDYELWKVYARGITGNIIGTIYTDWTCIADADFPREDGLFWGIDYGYQNDPTAVVKCLKIGESIFIHEVVYQTGSIPPRTIAQLLRANGYTAGMPLFAEHDPEQNRQLAALGITVIPARKGQGSLKAGIQKVKEYRIFYTYSSKNLKEELKRYVWEEDKSAGKMSNVPVDGWDDILSAIRYAIYTNFYRGRQPGIQGALS